MNKFHDSKDLHKIYVKAYWNLKNPGAVVENQECILKRQNPRADILLVASFICKMDIVTSEVKIILKSIWSPNNSQDITTKTVSMTIDGITR